jgi:hypothetical protein
LKRKLSNAKAKLAKTTIDRHDLGVVESEARYLRNKRFEGEQLQAPELAVSQLFNTPTPITPIRRAVQSLPYRRRSIRNDGRSHAPAHA